MTAPQTRLTREQGRARTRERLLAAAGAEVARRGFGGASVRDIAEAAGYSQGALYANFASKEALLLDLLREHMQGEAAQLQALLAADEGGADGVLARLSAWAETLDTQIDWSMLALELQLHAHRSPAFASEYDRAMAQHATALGDIVARFYRALGRRPQLDPRQLAAGFMALAHGLALRRRSDGDVRPGRLMMTFIDALLASAQRSG